MEFPSPHPDASKGLLNTSLYLPPPQGSLVLQECGPREQSSVQGVTSSVLLPRNDPRSVSSWDSRMLSRRPWRWPKGGWRGEQHPFRIVGPIFKSFLPRGCKRSIGPRVRQTSEQPLQGWKTLDSHSTCPGLSFLMCELERVRPTWQGQSGPQRT